MEKGWHLNVVGTRKIYKWVGVGGKWAKPNWTLSLSARLTASRAHVRSQLVVFRNLAAKRIWDEHAWHKVSNDMLLLAEVMFVFSRPFPSQSAHQLWRLTFSNRSSVCLVGLGFRGSYETPCGTFDLQTPETFDSSETCTVHIYTGYACVYVCMHTHTLI